MSQSYNRYVRRSRQIKPGASSSMSGKRAQAESLFKGQRFQPSLMPSQFSSQPWNNATIRHKIAQNSGSYLTSATLINVIQRQLGLSVTDSQRKDLFLPIEYRILKFSAWAIGGTSLRILPMDYLSGTSTSELTVLDSMAQKNMYACVGYQYPMSHQVKVLSAQSDKYNVFYLEADSTVELHISILWRPSDQGKLTLKFEYVKEDTKSKRHKTTMNLEVIGQRIKEITDMFEELSTCAMFQDSESADEVTVRRSERIASRTSSYEEINKE